MEIDKQEVKVEFYGGFYQTERMIMSKFYETFKYICLCRYFFKEK